jgi:hypothetical protein
MLRTSLANWTQPDAGDKTYRAGKPGAAHCKTRRSGNGFGHL